MMWGKKKKRKTDKLDTLVGQHTVVNGDIKFTGGLHVEGVIMGSVYAEDDDGTSLLQLSDHGRIEGEVSAPFVVLNGEVRGDVHSSAHIELLSKAQVTGNVYYNLIEMAIGAEVNGKLVHTVQPEPQRAGAADEFDIPGEES